MTDKTQFKKSFGNTLSSHQFQKKGQSWYLRGTDCIVVLNLQKADFSDMYYVNFGVWLNVLGEEKWPQENHCHVRSRLERLFPTNRELIFDACTIDSRTNALGEFTNFLRLEVIPFCESCQTTKGLKQNIETGRIPLHNVYYSAKVALGFDMPLLSKPS